MTGDRRHLVVVAQSMGAFSAALLCTRVPVDLLVLVAAMTPRPGETGGEWWENTGQRDAQRAAAVAEGRDPDDGDPATIFLHDVPPDVAAESAAHLRDQSGTPFARPYPLTAWPDVPTRFLLCRHDRLFPADFQRRVPPRIPLTTVATLGTRVVGFVTVHDDELEQLYVAAEARGRGVADVLIRHAERQIAPAFSTLASMATAAELKMVF